MDFDLFEITFLRKLALKSLENGSGPNEPNPLIILLSDSS